MKEQIRWYSFTLFYSLATPIFIFVLIFEYLNNISGGCSVEGPIDNTFWHHFWQDIFGSSVFIHGFIQEIIVAYVVIVLFTYPFETGLSFFEFSLPYTKGKNFIAKYIVSLSYLFLLFSFTYLFSTYFGINEFGGFNEIYLYLYLLSILFDTFYILSIFTLFGVLFKRTIGVIVGLLALFLIEDFIIAPQKLWLPPTIYTRPLLSFSMLFNYYQYVIIISIVSTVFSYIIYRRCEL